MQGIEQLLRVIRRLSTRELYLALSVAGGTLLYIDVERIPAIFLDLQDLGHPILFFCLTRLLAQHRPASASNCSVDSLSVYICMTLVAVSSELFQLWFDRDPSLRDLYGDFLGIVSARVLFSAGRSLSQSLHAGILATCLLGLSTYCAAPVLQGLSGVYVSIVFPRISDFETPLDSLRWSGGTRVVEHRASRNHALVSSTSPNSKQKIVFRSPKSDWSTFSKVQFRAKAMGTSPARIRVTAFRRRSTRLHPGHSRNFFVSKYFFLVPDTWSTFRSSFATNADDSVRDDVRNVAGLVIEAESQGRPTPFLIDDVVLLK
jgi:hypothetical protein